MTTTDHQQAAVRAMNRHRWATEEGKHYATMPLAQFEPLDSDRALLAAAAPHLRAAWADEVRAIDIPEHRLHDQLPSDHWYAGQKAMRDEIVTLLEGGGE